MRISSCLLAVVLIGGTFSMRASFAQDTSSGEKAPDAVDTRIGVQPRRAGAKPDKIGEAKPNVPPAAKNPHRRTFTAFGPSNRTERNSIGVPIGQREDIERSDNKQFGSPPGSRVPVNVTTGTARSPIGSGTKIEGQIAHPAPNAGRPVGWRAANHAVISGTGLVHRVPNSSGIGGPSTAAAGISGTSIRPKR